MKRNILNKTLITKKMKEYSITPMKISSELNITYTSWSSKLNGKRCIKADELLYLATRLDLKPSEILLQDIQEEV